MARIDTLANFLEDVATKIRSKTGSQATITPANYDTEIEKIAFKPNKRLNFSEPAAYTSITTLDLKNLDTSLLTGMNGMFSNLAGLTSLDLSGFDTSNVTNMTNMFNNCKELTTLDLSNFDTSNLKNAYNMFKDCSKLETITFGNNFTFSSFTSSTTTTGITNMFNNCRKLDNNTLNAILHICTTISPDYANVKTLWEMGIRDSWDNYANIPNLSNYQAFLDAGWTIS